MSPEVPRTLIYLIPHVHFFKFYFIFKLYIIVLVLQALFQEIGSLLDFFLLVSWLSQIRKSGNF